MWLYIYIIYIKQIYSSFWLKRPDLESLFGVVVLGKSISKYIILDNIKHFYNTIYDFYFLNKFNISAEKKV